MKNRTKSIQYDHDDCKLVPWISKNHIARILAEVKPGCRFLELGVGGSTLLWGAKIYELGGTLHVWDGDQGWMDRSITELMKVVGGITTGPDACPHAFTFRRTSTSEMMDVESHCEDAVLIVDRINAMFKMGHKPYDVVFIDHDSTWGEARHARLECLHSAIDWIKDDGSVFLHDSQNPRYAGAKTQYRKVWEGNDPAYKEAEAPKGSPPLMAKTRLWHGKKP